MGRRKMNSSHQVYYRHCSGSSDYIQTKAVRGEKELRGNQKENQKKNTKYCLILNRGEPSEVHQKKGGYRGEKVTPDGRNTVLFTGRA